MPLHNSRDFLKLRSMDKIEAGRLQLLFYEWKSRGNTIIRPSYFNIDFL